MNPQLEEMSAFFTARVDDYDRHMLEEVNGCREGYERMARLVPSGAKDVLDLGCGTGLELDALFKLRDGFHVTGIDLTQAMLDELRKKHPDQPMRLICGSYFEVDFGKECFDAALSFQTMHHFKPEKKLTLYRRIREALRPGGVYIECDYTADDDEQEAFFFGEYERLLREGALDQAASYHYDTPLTVQHQLGLFQQAGFARAQLVWKDHATALMLASL